MLTLDSLLSFYPAHLNKKGLAKEKIKDFKTLKENVMSLLAEKTEKNALYELAKCLRYLSNLESLWVSADDAFMVRTAENAIRRTIESNGYQPSYCKRKGTRLVKIK